MTPANSNALLDPSSDDDEKLADDFATNTVLVDPPSHSEDVIADCIYEVENMEREEALDLAGKLSQQVAAGCFKLGGALSLIQRKGWYDSHPSFQAYVEAADQLHYRKAMYYINIYEAVRTSKIPVDKFNGVTWSKLREIVAIVTPDNVDHWVEQSKTLTHAKLVAAVKAAKTHKAPDADVSVLKYVVDEKQGLSLKKALSKAKAISGTKSNGEALFNVCLDYLASCEGEQNTGDHTLKARVSLLKFNYKFDAIMHALSELFPEYDFNVQPIGTAESDDASDG